MTDVIYFPGAARHKHCFLFTPLNYLFFKVSLPNCEPKLREKKLKSNINSECIVIYYSFRTGKFWSGPDLQVCSLSEQGGTLPLFPLDDFKSKYLPFSESPATKQGNFPSPSLFSKSYGNC